MDFRFRPPALDDAAMLLDWRTRPDITRYLFTDLDHRDVDKQRAWLAAMEGREDFRHFLICDGDRPVGYLSYTEIDRVNRRCSSGSYVVEPEDRKRLADVLHAHIMDYCFHGLGLNKIVNQYMAGNDKVLRIQHLLKLRHVGLLREHVFKNGVAHDVHVFEQTRAEWETVRRPLSPEKTLAAFPKIG